MTMNVDGFNRSTTDSVSKKYIQVKQAATDYSTKQEKIQSIFTELTLPESQLFTFLDKVAVKCAELIHGAPQSELPEAFLDIIQPSDIEFIFYERRGICDNIRTALRLPESVICRLFLSN